MPIMKSAMKALRQAKKRTVRNAKVKDNIAYLRRTLRQALEKKEVSKATEIAKQVVKNIDKAIQNKVLKKNTGSRMKSRLMLAVNKVSKK
ncbi:MAG: 30S ribosomal protein S20 [Patescibacteria group bacterium]|nr:30S ribosomal protein S20 [Patescibacteria group bacterium]